MILQRCHFIIRLQRVDTQLILQRDFLKLCRNLQQIYIFKMTKGSAQLVNMDRVDFGNSKMVVGEMTTVGEKLSDALVEAQKQNRLTCGLYESGLVLETNPDSVMMCILPTDKSDDVTLDIHYTLIEAFCLENDIRLLKVDSSEKLTELLGDFNLNDAILEEETDNACSLEDDVGWYEPQKDYNCLLIQYPRGKQSEIETDLLAYHDHTSNMMPQPVVELAV